MKKNTTTKSTLISWLLAISIVLTGLIFRVQSFITNLFAYTYDVGRDLLKLHQITTTWDVPLIGQTSGLHGLFYGPWWYYTLIPAFIVGQGDPKAVLGFMILSGIICIILGIFSGSILVSLQFGLLFGAFISLSSGLIGVSSQIWNPNTIPMYIMMLFSIYSYIATRSTRLYVRYILLIIFGFVLGLILDSEIVFGVLFLGGLVLSLLFYRKLLTIKYVLLSSLGFLIVLLPRIVFDIRHELLMTKTFLGFIQGQGTSTTTYGTIQPINAIHELFNMWTKTVASDSEIIGAILLTVVLICSYNTYRFVSTIHKRVLVTSLTILFSFFVGLSLFPDAIWDHYIIGLPIVYIFILTSVLYMLYSHKKSIYRYSGYALIVAVILFNLHYQISLSFFNGSWEGDVSTYNTHLDVVDHIYENAKGEEFKFIVYTPPVHSYTYNYLFLWYGPKNYAYSPSEQADLMYVIIEPDYEDHTRRDLWMEQRKTDGELIEEFNLGGDIIVQKKQIDVEE